MRKWRLLKNKKETLDLINKDNKMIRKKIMIKKVYIEKKK